MARKKKPDLSAGLVVAYVRKSPSGFPPDCVTPEQRRAYIDDLTRVRIGELTADAAADKERIDHFYVDMYVSGTGQFLEERVQFLKMWEDALAGKIRRIYARDSARIARDFIQADQFFTDMASIGVVICVPDLPSSENLTEEQLVGYESSRRHIAVANEMLARLTAAKVKRNHREKIESGSWSGRGRSQWGLRYNKETDWFDYDPETAPMIIELFKMFVDKGGIAKHVANDLNSRITAGDETAFRTPNGVLWTSNIVLRLVRNGLYARLVTWGDLSIDRSDKIPEVVPSELVAQARSLAVMRTGSGAAMAAVSRSRTAA